MGQFFEAQYTLPLINVYFVMLDKFIKIKDIEQLADHPWSTSVGNMDQRLTKKLAMGRIRSGDGMKKSDPSKLVASLLCNVGLLTSYSKTARDIFSGSTKNSITLKRHRDLVTNIFSGFRKA